VSLNYPSGIKLKTDNQLPHILYVEDDEIGREVLALFLKGKYTVDLVGNPDEVLSKISKIEYAAILLDINLGKGMSGIELVKEIRKLPKYDKVPLIAVTAYALREIQTKILNSGCTHYISKPFNRNTLVTLIDNALNQS
jgi:two-component system, sensor histidine kinase